MDRCGGWWGDRRNRDRVRIRIETQLKENFMRRMMDATTNYESILDDVLRKRNNPHDAAESMLDRVRIARP